MPRIEIESVNGNGYETIVKVDGRELTDVRELTLRCAVDSVIEANVTVFATDKLNVTTEAMLNLSVVVDPGYRLIEEVLPDGRKAYTAEFVN